MYMIDNRVEKKREYISIAFRAHIDIFRYIRYFDIIPAMAVNVIGETTARKTHPIFLFRIAREHTFGVLSDNPIANKLQNYERPVITINLSQRFVIIRNQRIRPIRNIHIMHFLILCT